MKKLTKTNIEELAQEIMEFLERTGMMSSVSIYYNGKVVRANSDYSVKDDDFTYSWKTTENVDPHDYFEWAAYDHILSMSFEGPLYEVLNYTFGKMEERFREIFDKYGLYFEFGNAWNLTAYLLDDDVEVEYTVYERPKETINLYRYNRDENPHELQSIMDEWFVQSSMVGDKGSCVLGAGFRFEWEGDKYFMSACSPYQGSISWEEPKDKIQKMLEDIGATEIYFDYGRMD